MHHRFKIKYTKDIVLNAARQFFWRHIGVFGLTAFILLWSISAGFLLAGNYDWYVIAILTVASVTTILVVAAFVIYRHRALAGFRRFDPPIVEFLLTDSGIKVESSMGSSMVQWPAIQRVWIFKELCLLFVGRNQYVTIPKAQISTAALADMLDRLRSEGVLVSQWSE